MAAQGQNGPELSPWWKIGVVFTIIAGFSVLIFGSRVFLKGVKP